MGSDNLGVTYLRAILGQFKGEKVSTQGLTQKDLFTVAIKIQRFIYEWSQIVEDSDRQDVKSSLGCHP